MDLKDAKYLIHTLAVVAVGLQQKKQIANMSGLKLTLNIGTNKKSVLTAMSVSSLYGRVSAGIGANVLGLGEGCQCVSLVRLEAAFAKPLLADGTAHLRET